MTEGRTPCINPRCKCTASAEKFPDEMICYKCFKALPTELRTEHREIWRQYRLYGRRIARTSDVLKIVQLRNIQNRWAFRLEANWRRIREYTITPEKPEGLDNFLAEVFPS
ncbi:hypothetical protein EVC13_030 [Rhizobium phage RHph_I65]|nr:hypothetical protein EVC13_030 [Rhizobium phage RHph_I65]